MLHPFMPFITEELWHAMSAPATPRGGDLIHAEWPKPEADVDAEAKAEIEWVIQLVSGIRAARNEIGIAPKIKMVAFVRGASLDTHARIDRQDTVIESLARIKFIRTDKTRPASVQVVVDEATFNLELDGAIDVPAERARLTKAIEAATKEATSLAGRLNNPAFVEKAKPEAVEKARADHAEKSAEAERLQAALARLG